MSGSERTGGPSVAKVRAPSPVARRMIALLSSSDAWWEDWFERADIMSEGLSTVEEGQGIYRGTTSVILTEGADGQGMQSKQVAELVRIATRDPHLRLRLVRLARREAASRSSQPLGCTFVEIKLTMDAKGLRADLDVVAREASGMGRVGWQGQ
jgi:hypothetical protein